MDRAALARAAEGIGLRLSDGHLDAFEAFEGRLYLANEVMNLTRVPREECWLRHFLDSLLFHDLVPQGARVLDIGTGPGFPAWPLACARPDLSVTAVDSSGKMLGFLKRNPLPNLQAVQARAEDWGVREAFDFITGRAVAPLPVQLELSAAPCAVGGLVVPMRTPAEREAIDRFEGQGLGLRFLHALERALPRTDVVRLFPLFLKEEPTERRYPRLWAEIKRRPLD